MSGSEPIRTGVYAEAGAHVTIERQVVHVGGLGFQLQPDPRPVRDTASAVEALRPGAAIVPLGRESDALLTTLDDWLDGPRASHVAVGTGWPCSSPSMACTPIAEK